MVLHAVEINNYRPKLKLSSILKMAMVLSFSDEDNKARKSSFRSGEKKPWMLKDYLRDDVGSCSSNGFRSFPRRQCCVAVRNIIEKEVTRNHHRHHRRRHSSKHMLSRSDFSFSYAVQRASMAVINAVKIIPFNTPVKNDGGKRLLPRSFSKKLFSKRSFFWKKDKRSNSNRRHCEDQFDEEIERWISSGVVGKEKYQPLDFSNDTTVTNVSTTSISNSDGKSDGSWSDITFTSDSSENDDVERREKMEVSKIVGLIAGEDSVVEPAIKEEKLWFDEEAEIKQQTSPISVLDFLHNYEGGSSPITPRSAQSKRTKERLMKKLAELEPVNLESLLLSPEIIQDQSPQCSIQSCSAPSFILSTTQSEDEEELKEEEQSHENEDEKHAKYLLNITRRNSPLNKAYKFELENVLLDYFRENVTQKESHTLLKAAEDWLNGYYDNLILGWEMKDKRQSYIRDMEEGGWWPKDTKLEREEVGAKLGDEVLAHLIEELMVEL